MRISDSPRIWAAAACGLLACLPGAARADDAADRQAVLALNSITGNSSVLGVVKELVADKGRAERLTRAGRDLVAAAKKGEEPLNFNAAYILGLVAADRKDEATARPLLESCVEQARRLQSPSKLSQAYSALVALYNSAKKYEDAARVYREFIKEDVEGIEETTRFEFRRRLVMTLARLGKEAEALKMLDEIVAELPDGASPYVALYMRGSAYQELGRVDKAEAAFLDAIEEVKKSGQISAKGKQSAIVEIRYLLTSLYSESNNVDKATGQLEELIKLQPERATYYNDLGFIWADNDKNLDKAEEYVRKALELDRAQRKDQPASGEGDRAAYLDSLGWVLFKKKQYREAKEQLLVATKDEDEGQHLEILDHLADVHMALGEKAEAVKVWEKALLQEDVSKKDAERRKRVEEKLKKAKGE